MSIGGAAKLGMDIKEPSLFKSAKDLTPMSKDSFDGGKPKLSGEVPPMTSNEDKQKQSRAQLPSQMLSNTCHQVTSSSD